jgi:hypothetical protein
MLWMCLWMCPHHDTSSLIDQAFGILLLRIHARQQTTALYLVVEALHSFIMTPTSMSKIYKVPWMCLWMCSYQDTASLIYQVFWIFLRILGSARQQTTLSWSDWGSTLIHNYTHFNIKHILGVWQPSYAVDVPMDVFLPGYRLSHLPTLLYIAENPG